MIAHGTGTQAQLIGNALVAPAVEQTSGSLHFAGAQAEGTEAPEDLVSWRQSRLGERRHGGLYDWLLRSGQVSLSELRREASDL